MRALVALFALVASVASAPPSDAAPMTGNDLHKYCAEDPAQPEGTYAEGVCMGYMLAVIESSTTPLCVPKGVKVKQSIDIVRKYLKEHPETRHQWARALVEDAVKSAFCKK